MQSGAQTSDFSEMLQKDFIFIYSEEIGLTLLFPSKVRKVCEEAQDFVSPVDLAEWEHCVLRRILKCLGEWKSDLMGGGNGVLGVGIQLFQFLFFPQNSTTIFVIGFLCGDIG